MQQNQAAILLLEDGTVFKGIAIGKIGTTGGEIAFNTGMTGYQEVFTDPSYLGQLLIMNTAHIGNYGVHATEIESESIKIAGLITKKFSNDYSRVAAEESLQALMERNGTVGISDIDTRALVRHIRNKGAMNAMISSEILDIAALTEKLKEVPSMDGLELSSRVSTNEAYEVCPEDAKYRVSLLDLGVKKNIVRCLVERGCHVKVFPMTATKAELDAFQPDGYMLSNGPGDPSVMTESIALVKEIAADNNKNYVALSIGTKGSGKTFFMLKYLKYALKNNLYDQYVLVLPMFEMEQNGSYKFINVKNPNIFVFESYYEVVTSNLMKQQVKEKAIKK